VNIQKVLLVDDDQTLLLVAQIGLQTQQPDWQIDLAFSGLEAINLAIAEKPDLILLDIEMPGLDGKATFARLKEINVCAYIPVIFVTAESRQELLDTYLALGAIGIISKPFDPMSLSAHITELTKHL